MIIAMDGPAGAGKSTVCRILAERLGFVYLDTGAMYRALAWVFNKHGLSYEDHLRDKLERIPLLFSIRENRLEIFWGKRPLSDELRDPQMSEAASKISRIHAVREFMVAWQRKLGEHASNIVAEGRDTATVVFPDADLKVFLTADLKTRAKRRLAEYGAKGISLSLEEMQACIQERDEADSKRDHSPMRPAEGAVILDTSALGVEDVVDRLGQMVKNMIGTAS